MTDTRLANDFPEHSDEAHAPTTIRTSTLPEIQPNATKLGFMDLPLELRFMIYRHTFPDDEIHIVVYRTSTRIHPYQEQISNLLRLNRQITQEVDAICTYVVLVYFDSLADENSSINKSQEICKLLAQANKNFTVRIELDVCGYFESHKLLRTLPECNIEVKTHFGTSLVDNLIRRVDIWKSSGVVQASVTVIRCQEQGMKCYRYLWGA
ncbi:unnamed protein product [Aureobasidium pullulans]|uniref:2EXR domain-containing protein n=1 Tax=Aureobasidium pullulans TaxID=5580 RepID=A0A4S8WZ37_AURPU|nr:hypothetical protein D6D22_10681 [Aureobasidium pullulans]TIA33626.1 hypothetical protein D6C79_08920 [Aureobasidium pullulans]CAC9885794.1 unnamed protein product [Aureobasidium pullulans]